MDELNDYKEAYVRRIKLSSALDFPRPLTMNIVNEKSARG